MLFSPEIEAYIDHEVRLRTLGSEMSKAIERMDEMERRIEDKFNIMLGIVIVGVLLPIALHAFKLI